MNGRESLIRARYAVSVLRVAKVNPRMRPSRWLDTESDDKIAEARTNATVACEELAVALRGNSPKLRSAWDQAANTATHWLSQNNR